MDIETLRKKQQALMVRLVERKVRSRAQQLYETRGEGDGQELDDWFQAESEVLENNVVASLYRRMRTSQEVIEEANEQAENESSFAAHDSSACENPA